MQALKELAEERVASPRTEKRNDVSDLKPRAILSDVGAECVGRGGLIPERDSNQHRSQWVDVLIRVFPCEVGRQSQRVSAPSSQRMGQRSPSNEVRRTVGRREQSFECVTGLVELSHPTVRQAERIQSDGEVGVQLERAPTETYRVSILARCEHTQ